MHEAPGRASLPLIIVLASSRSHFTQDFRRDGNDR